MNSTKSRISQDDICVLNSGGPQMTVVGFHLSSAICAWSTPEGVKGASFDPVCLTISEQ